MKTFRNLSVAALAVVVGSLAWADHHESGETGPWFDMEKCACCKHMGENMDMMMDLQWENHLIKDGGMMTAVIPEQHKKRWDALCEKMKDVEGELAQGKQLPMCNFCQSYGKLMEAGANMEEIKTGFGSVTLITSDKPEVVDMIHKHIKRTQDEHKKMMAMMQQPQ